MVNTDLTVPISNQPVTHKNKKFIKVLLFLGVPLIAVIGAVVIFTLIFILPLMPDAKKIYALGQETVNAVKNQDLVTTEAKAKEVKDSLMSVEYKYKRIGWLKIIPFINNYYLDGDRAIKAALAGTNAILKLTDAVVPYADVLGLKGKGSFTGGTAEDRIIKIIQTLNEITPKLGEAGGQLQIVQDNLAAIDPNRYPSKFKGNNIKEMIIKLQETGVGINVSFNEVLPGLEVLPKVLGYPNYQKYLLLMQNDGELRATGGFMTAYAVVKIDGGKIILEKSDDIYSLDKKNKTKVKAPAAIEKYLFSANLNTGIVPYWYIRDMNLSPDFKISMDTFKKYYDPLPLESPIDGIITIDTKVLKDLLTLLGPVEVPGFGKFTMDKDSRCHDIPQVVCELEYIVDTPIAGVKESRKGVLGPLMGGILTKIFSTPSQYLSGLFKLAMEEITQKHVLLYFVDEKTQTAAEKLNAAGRIRLAEQDYLHINDTNFGGAKSNLFVSETVEQKITIKDNQTIEKTLTISYVNPEEMDNCNLERVNSLCLNGILRDYIRIYVPKGSKLLEAMGSEEDFIASEDLDKTVFEGFFILRGGGGKAKLIITYELPFKYDPKTYNLLIQKQPGTDKNHYIINFGENTQEFDLTTDKLVKF